jgi:hypothetical protein
MGCDCVPGGDIIVVLLVYMLQLNHSSRDKTSTTQAEVSIILSHIISYPRLPIVTVSVTNCQMFLCCASGFFMLCRGKRFLSMKNYQMTINK